MVDIVQLLDEADSLRNKQGNLSGALEKINQVLEFDANNVLVLVQKSILLRDLGNLAEAEEVLILALEQVNESDDLLIANILRLSGFISLLKGNIDIALEKANKSQEKAIQSESLEMQANAEALLGNIYQTKGDLDQAKLHYTEALEKAKKSRFIEREITVSINIATVSAEKGDTDSALAILNEIIERSQGRWHKALFNALFEKGKILLQSSSVDDEYITALQSAYKIAMSNGWSDEQGNLALQLGRIFYKLSENDIAREYFQTAQIIFQKAGIDHKLEIVNKELQKI